MKLVSLAFLFLLVPTVAAAQSSGVFIQAGPMLDVLQTSSYGPIRASSASLSAVIGEVTGGIGSPVPNDEQMRSTQERFAPGAAIAVGVFVSPSVSLRVETSIQGDHVSTAETTSASERSRAFIQNTIGVTDISVAAAWHQGSGRVGVSYLAGLVFRRQTDDTFTSFTYPTLSLVGPGGRPVQVIATETDEDNFRTVSYDRGIMAGIDVSVRISDRIAIVPQVRLVSAMYSWNVRPTLAVRWRP